MSARGGRPHGYKHKEETKQKISAKLIGRKRSEEWQEKLANANIGKHKYWLGKIGEKSARWDGGKSIKHSAKLRERKAKLRLNGGGHTIFDWRRLKAQYNWTCPSCHRKEPNIKLTKDHIVPIWTGGSDNIENIQPLCHLCNCIKRKRIIRYEHN